MTDYVKNKKADAAFVNNTQYSLDLNNIQTETGVIQLNYTGAGGTPAVLKMDNFAV